MASLLKTASEQAYAVNGSQAIVDGESGLLPGIPLNAFPVNGRGCLIAPTIVARAFHNRGSVGDSFRLRNPDGTEQSRTVVEFSPRYGDDGVLMRLDSPMTIPFVRPVADLIKFIEDGERLLAFRVTYNGGFRLTVGDFAPNFPRGLLDLNEIPGDPNWAEAITGDSGGGNFLMVEDTPYFLGGTWNEITQSTAIGLHREEVLDFAPEVDFFDFNEMYRDPRVNPTPASPNGEVDTSQNFYPEEN